MNSTGSNEPPSQVAPGLLPWPILQSPEEDRRATPLKKGIDNTFWRYFLNYEERNTNKLNMTKRYTKRWSDLLVI